ncbi:MAG: hypothetical protein H6627_11785 [Calditrichae bacterium]|nr:hypothetical protein [Calditrichota bacterium]MCB9059240.1 hypothetical protein [Calditrichia bacterium]
MADSVIKLGKRLKGIRHHDFYKNPQAGFKVNEVENAVSPNQILTDARRIKHLEDRIHILEKELQRAREDSFQAGYDEGKQRTLQEAQNRVDAMYHEMKQQELNFKETIEQMEKPLLELAKKMAVEVIQKEIEHGADTDQILVERLKKMLSELVEQNNIIIKINPQQFGVLKNTDLTETFGLSESTNVKILGNKNLQPGEVKIETEDYFVDGTFENHAKKVHDELGREDQK